MKAVHFSRFNGRKVFEMVDLAAEELASPIRPDG
jgi:hypothetical protein